MANNHLQFSETLSVTEPTHIKWWEDVLMSEDDPDKPQWARDVFKECKESVGEDDADAYYFQADICLQKIWFYAEEGGRPYEIGFVVQAYLKHFDMEEIFTLNYAEHCSKLRVGEFGGGYIVASKEELINESTFTHCDREVESILEGRKARAEQERE